MTSANVFSWTTANAGTSINANAAASKPKTDDSMIAGMFASMMHAGCNTALNSPDVSVSRKYSDISASADAYGRYQYRDNEIGSADTPKLADKISESADVLEDFKEQVTAEVAEELDVSVEEVQIAMEVLGLTVFDLMDPQNLAQLALELTGVDNVSDLLLDSQFTDLMQQVEMLGEGIMEELDIPADQTDAAIAQMNVQDQTEYQPEAEYAKVQESVQQASTETEENMEAGSISETVVQIEAEAVKAAQPDTENAVQDVQSGEEAEDIPEEMVAAEAPDKSDDEGNETDNLFDRDSRSRTFETRTEHEPAVGMQPVTQDFAAAAEAVQQTQDSYMSADTADMIEQIVQRARVSISEESTSMEMQLNPENLGKVYLQVTAKEGAVHAQIAAADEAVKNALEMQVAELKESLNQAGVKVEAIEVTVASHEFEQNLEQDARREEQEGERAEANASAHRRSIKLDSLDELSGVMTEEEALVAQIMRDNGNSMDLSA